MVFTLLIAMAELASAETRDLSNAVRSLQAQLQQAEARRPLAVEPERTPPSQPMPMDQLHNPRTGVTCTMRILQARPVDPEAVAPAPDATVDPDIRAKRVSPCVD